MWELSRSIRRAMNLHQGLNNSVSTLQPRTQRMGSTVANMGHPPQHCPCGDRPHAFAGEDDPRAHQQQRASERAEAAETLLSMVEADPATHGQLAAAIDASAWLPAWERTKTNNTGSSKRSGCHCVNWVADMSSVKSSTKSKTLVGAQRRDGRSLWPHTRGLTERVRERRSTHSQLAEREPEFVFADSPSDPSSWPKRNDVEVEPLDAGDSIQGFPGCPGVSRGCARRTRLERPNCTWAGDVLVVDTDPSWTPLFVPAGGVVVDVGAALSHAIIVSRELGIPCVVSATNATRRIAMARVRVDGNTGVVTVLD